MPNIEGKVASLVSQLDGGTFDCFDCRGGILDTQLQYRLSRSGSQQMNFDRLKSAKPNWPGGSEARYLKKESGLPRCVEHFPEIEVVSLGEPDGAIETENFDRHWKIVAAFLVGIVVGASLVERRMRLANAEV